MRFGPLGVELAAGASISAAQARHLHALLHQLAGPWAAAAAGGRASSGGGVAGRWRRSWSAGAASVVGRRRRRLRRQRLRRDAGFGLGHLRELRLARPPGLVAFAAAVVVGLGEEVGLLRRLRRCVVWVRITSSVGITGAASSRLKPTPRISTPKPIIDSARVAVSRSDGPICGGRHRRGSALRAPGGRAGRACPSSAAPRAGPRSRRTAARRCSARTACPARGRRSGW